LTGLLPATKHCHKAELPPLKAGSFTKARDSGD